MDNIELRPTDISNNSLGESIMFGRSNSPAYKYIFSVALKNIVLYDFCFELPKRNFLKYAIYVGCITEIPPLNTFDSTLPRLGQSELSKRDRNHSTTPTLGPSDDMNWLYTVYHSDGMEQLASLRGYEPRDSRNSGFDGAGLPFPLSSAAAVLNLA